RAPICLSAAVLHTVGGTESIQASLQSTMRSSWSIAWITAGSFSRGDEKGRRPKAEANTMLIDSNTALRGRFADCEHQPFAVTGFASVREAPKRLAIS